MLSTLSAVLTAVMIGGCGLEVEPPFGPCPSTVAEAAAIEHGRELYLATGHAIRFIPADDPEFRGYDVNLQARDGEPYYNTVLLRTPDRIPGIADGQPVLLVGERSDRTSAVSAGDCPALVPIAEEDIAAPWVAEDR